MSRTRNEQLALRRFPKDTSEHRMTVALDQGVHRHLRFAKPKNSWNMAFAITTWPGHLAITGDMDTYVWARSYDMVDWALDRTQQVGVSWSYWAEKLQAPSTDGARRFDQDDATDGILAHAQGCDWFDGLTADQAGDLREKLSELAVDADASIVADRLYNFRWQPEDENYRPAGEVRSFDNDSETISDLTRGDFSFHFYWACLAVQWGLRQYMAAGGHIEPEPVRRRRPLGHVIAPLKLPLGRAA